ncbi:hypothetical protein G6F21_012510 [Rhizopus arrhizus]|nr:hypothetical protein G6F21_012510 [Rhizopus arrhizus]KAG1276329.1 hypothetical protein G6F66_012567 [Rhizopus arrhizus]
MFTRLGGSQTVLEAVVLGSTAAEVDLVIRKADLIDSPKKGLLTTGASKSLICCRDISTTCSTVTTGWKSPSELSSTLTDVDNTVSRPTRIKPESKPSEVASITPTPTEASSSSFEDNAQKEADVYLTVAYVIFGSLAVFGVTTGLCFYKRNGWYPLDKVDKQQSRPGGYEFDMLRPLTEHDEEDEEEDEKLGNN